jgi:hypothetical protein
MTTSEFNNEFDVIYYSAASNGAAPLDTYEKSVFLTQAQEEIIKNYYNPKSNRLQEGFEKTEKRRQDIGAIVKTFTSNQPFIDTSSQISNRSLYFLLPNDNWLITYESVKISANNTCYNDSIIENVVPVKLDEYSTLIKNPFKKPDFNTVFRLTSDNFLNAKRVEIIYGEGYLPIEYKIRYIKKPKPIILETLTQGLTIDGISTQSDCELNDIVHREILNRAIELALESTGNPRLQSKTQLNTRNE